MLLQIATTLSNFKFPTLSPAEDDGLGDVRRGGLLNNASKQAKENFQTKLNVWLKSNGHEEIKVDGILGKETASAARLLQASTGLTKTGAFVDSSSSDNIMLVDGKVGFRTMRALDRALEPGKLLSEQDFTTVYDSRGLHRRSPAINAGLNGIRLPDLDFTGEMQTKRDKMFAGIIEHASNVYGVPRALIDAVAQVESGYNPRAESKVGAVGVMQLMPRTAEELGVVDRTDPVANIMGGTKYLAQLWKQFDGNVELTVAAYNAGPGAVKRYGGIPPFKETQEYVAKIMSRLESQNLG